jgi:toxin ParE1/3/4
MTSYSFTPEAANDLGEIYTYVANEDMVAARQLLDRLTGLFRKLSTMPGLGRKRPELGQDIRSFPTGRYVIYYRVVEQGIQLMRIIHGARDVEKMFNQDWDRNDENL